MREYLIHYKEQIPDWLANFNKNNIFRIKDFCRSRVVFVAGSGLDGSPVKIFGSAHFAHCYLYTDYGLTREEIIAELDSPIGKFRGYSSLYRVPLAEDSLTPNGWKPHLTRAEMPQYEFARAKLKPYAFAEVLERDANFDDQWGPARLFVLFVGGDAVATYDAFFGQEGETQAPAIAVIQDHAFGGGYTSFGKGGLLELIAKRTIKLPSYLWVAEGTEPWVGYSKVPNALPERCGEWGRPSYLYKINEYTYEDLSSLTSVDIRQLRYLVAEGLVPAPTGKTKGTRFDENHLLLLMLIKAKQDEGYSIAQIKKSMGQIRGWISNSNAHADFQNKINRRQITEFLITEGVKLTIDPIESTLNDELIEKIVTTLEGMVNGTYLFGNEESLNDQPQISFEMPSIQNKVRKSHNDIDREKLKESLELLRNELMERLGNTMGEIGRPDVDTTPQDPHLVIKNFYGGRVDLQIKLQLTGQSVVLNMIPQGSSQYAKAEFTDALTSIQSPYSIRKGNKYGLYAPTNNFKEKSEGLRHGVPRQDLKTIIRLMHEAKKRLDNRKNT